MTAPSEILKVTDSAATKVYELIQDEGNFDLKLRVFVVGGGCSGFQYGFSFDEKVNEDDFVIVKEVAIANVNDDEKVNEDDLVAAKEVVIANANDDEKVNEDDLVIAEKAVLASVNDTDNNKISESTHAEIKLVIDAQSFAHLKGAEIDYRKDIHGEQFIIRNNPNAKTTCGCGSSFSAE